MGEKIMYIFSDEILVIDKNGQVLQFDNSLYMESNGYFNILQDDEIVYSGAINEIKLVRYDSKEDVIFV
jgi:hypothetical protein